MILINDTEYTPEKIREHKNYIIELREAAIKQHEFDWSLILSVTIGLLNELAKRVEKESDPG